MAISETDIASVTALNVALRDDSLTVDIADGRTIVVPLAWFPRLLHATSVECSNWRLIGRGEGIHWPDLDEDVSVESLLAGRASRETAESLRKWMAERQASRAH